VELIHQAGGTATLAHPGSSKVNPLEMKQFAQSGLDGLEVGHLDHPPSFQEKLRSIAKELGLVCTAGSDFHGMQVAPNRAFGHVTMLPAELDALEARRSLPQ
jgi:predicted metal-dependent phosphoesterase TrpH